MISNSHELKGNVINEPGGILGGDLSQTLIEVKADKVDFKLKNTIRNNRLLRRKGKSKKIPLKPSDEEFKRVNLDLYPNITSSLWDEYNSSDGELKGPPLPVVFEERNNSSCVRSTPTTLRKYNETAQKFAQGGKMSEAPCIGSHHSEEVIGSLEQESNSKTASSEIPLDRTGKTFDHNARWKAVEFQKASNMSQALFNDPVWVHNKEFIEKNWDAKVDAVRIKTTGRDQFFEFCEANDIQIEPPCNIDTNSNNWLSQKAKLFNAWRDSISQKDKAKPYVESERQAFWNRYKFAKKYTGCFSTQEWGQPSGILYSLTHGIITALYTFVCGKAIFPFNYRSYLHNFLSRTELPDGHVTNPPYDEKLLNPIIAHAAKLAYRCRGCMVMLLPYFPSCDWYKFLQAINTPLVKLKTPIAYYRKDGSYANAANFRSVLAFVGAYTHEMELEVNNDSLGFFKFTPEILSAIQFPKKFATGGNQIAKVGWKQRINLLGSLMTIAERHYNLEVENFPYQIVQDYDFSTMQKYNYILQSVDSVKVNLSHQWVHQLDPVLRQFTTWKPIPERRRNYFTNTESEQALKVLNQCAPRDKFKNTTCGSCHLRGHNERNCVSAVPSAARLGLTSLDEKILYQFLTTELSFPYRHDELFPQKSPQDFMDRIMPELLSREQKFWDAFRKYSASQQLTSWDALLKNSEFSKGRQSIGFNYGMGAPLWELVSDAFGFIVEVIDAPEPFEIIEGKQANGEPIYGEIDPDLVEQDETEAARNTFRITPKKYIRYIFARKTVVNGDQTKRVINNCRPLGPHTPIYHQKMSSPQMLRHYCAEDIVLKIDGKSAFYQRKLCWRDRNLIGFRTRINGVVCYVCCWIPPFGYHNSGYMYNRPLKAKIRRCVPNAFHIDYVDDLSLKIGSKRDGPEVIQFNVDSFLWLLTKCGEAINDKFDLYQNSVRMLGCHYNLRTDRLVPKFDNFYKLCLLMAQILKNNKYSLHQVEKLAGKLNWVMERTFKEVFSSLYVFVGNQKRIHGIKEKSDSHRSKRISFGLDLNLTDVLFESTIKLTEQYLNFKVPAFGMGSKTLYIIVDSNPAVAAGYMLFEGKNIAHKCLRSAFALQRIDITHPSDEFVKRFNLEKLINSAHSELRGLWEYISSPQVQPILQDLLQVAANVVVCGDNQGVVYNLNTFSKKPIFISAVHRNIKSFLSSFGKPVSYVWLRRSEPEMDLADHLGREYSLRPMPSLIAKIKRSWNVKLFTPGLFTQPHLIPLVLPAFQINKIKSKMVQLGTPLMLLNPHADISVVSKCFSFLQNTGIPAVIGFPWRAESKLRALVDKSKVVFVKKYTKVFFKNPERFSSINYPYGLFFFRPSLKKHNLIL